MQPGSAAVRIWRIARRRYKPLKKGGYTHRSLLYIRE